ncbi:MAG: hypothetical protein ABI808_03950 [Pseudonocardiales bacterium]
MPPPGGDVGLPASLAIVDNARSVQLTVRNDGQSIAGITTGLSVVLIDAAGLIIATDNTLKPASAGVSALAVGSSVQRVEQPVFDVCPHAPGVHRTPTPGDYFAVGVFTSETALSSATTALTIHPDGSLST